MVVKAKMKEAIDTKIRPFQLEIDCCKSLKEGTGPFTLGVKSSFMNNKEDKKAMPSKADTTKKAYRIPKVLPI